VLGDSRCQGGECLLQVHPRGLLPQGARPTPPRLARPQPVYGVDCPTPVPPLSRCPGATAGRRRSRPRAGGRRTFYGDLHPLDADQDVGPPAGAGEVNDHPVLIAHGGDVTTVSQDRTGADGRVMAADVLAAGQLVHVTDHLNAADAPPHRR